MTLLSLRFEHPSHGGFGEVASELVRLANQLGVTTLCKINSGSDMFARWKRWEHDRAQRELDTARAAVPVALSPADAAAFRRAGQIVNILRANGFELAADLIARTFGIAP
jgi:hypothetical protein